MPVAYRDKPIELLREEVIDQLIMNYGHGEISLEAFERRLDEAYEGSDHDALQRLTEDLTLEVDPSYTEKKKEELGIHYTNEEPDEIDYMVDIMGGSNRGGVWTVPRELRIISIMGGAEVDFSEARFAQRDVKVRVFCLMGGVEIKIPEQVSTYSKAICIMGGVENKGSLDPDSNGPRIIVEGLVIMGGVSIKVKRPLRETWRNFADEMRSYFGFAVSDQGKS